MIYNNLRLSFPNKTEDEIQVILCKSYANLADIFVEAFKGMSFTEKDVVHRFRKVGAGWDTANAVTAKGSTFLGTGAHYCNWEWGALAMQIHLDAPIYGIYKPIQNDRIDAFMRDRRGQWGLHLRPTNRTAETLVESVGKAYAIFMVSDQSPSNTDAAYWFNFLNRRTPFLHGLEKHARTYNYPVFYFDVERVARGRYDVTATLLADNPSALADGELTRRYATHLEALIQREPANWLWTHNRFKWAEPIK